MADYLGGRDGNGNGLRTWHGGAPPVIYDHTGRPFREGEEKAKRYDDFAVPAVMTFAGIIRGSHDTYLHGLFDESRRRSREDAISMDNDVFLQGLRQERTLAVCSRPWHLVVDDEYDRRQQAVKDHLTKVIRTTPRLKDLIYYLLDGAVWYGRFGAQVKWRWKDIDGRRSLCLAKHLPVNGDKIGHTLDHTPYVLVHGADDGQFEGNPDLIYSTEGRALKLSGSWRERFVLHKHMVTDADFLDPEAAEAVHGVGVRHRVFWLDFLRKEYLSWLVDFLERVGLGVTVFYYDGSNPNSKAEAERAAHEQNRRSVILWPKFPDRDGGRSQGVERVETPTGGAAVLLQMQQHVEDVINRYVVGQTLSSGTEGSGLGGSGVAALHEQTKANIIQWDAANLGETLTTDVVDVIKRWTCPGCDFPVRWEFVLEDPDPAGRIGIAAQLYTMGVALKTQELRTAGGFSDPDPDDDVVVMPQQMEPGAQQQGGMPPGGQDQQQGGQDMQAQLAAAMGGESDPEYDRLYRAEQEAAGKGPERQSRRGRRVSHVA